MTTRRKPTDPVTSRSVTVQYFVDGQPDAQDGRSEAINILTATRLGLRARAQKFGFWLARRPRWQAENIAGSRPQAVQLKRLNFIHTARWVDVGRFPKFARDSRLRGAREPWAPYRWVLFCSNLNQHWEPYLQAFLDSFGSGIHTLWGDSVDYPGFPRPRTRNDTNEWIQHRLPLSQLFYCAYPHLTTNDVRSLVRRHREELSDSLDDEATKKALGTTPEPAKRRKALATRLQHTDVRTLTPPSGWMANCAPAFGPLDCTGIDGFVSLMPLRPGTENRVAELLASCHHPCQDSPFRTVPGTHFARLAVLDKDRAGTYPGRDIRLRRSWLMFSADFDSFVTEADLGAVKPPQRRTERYAETYRYFQSVVSNPDLAEIFHHCYPKNDPPAPGELVDDLMHSICKRLVYFRDYADTTLREIYDAAIVPHRAVTGEDQPLGQPEKEDES